MNSGNKNLEKFPMYRSEVKELFFQEFCDSRGKLVSIEGGKSIPFNIARVYYIYDTMPETERGFHAHKNLKQILVALHGKVQIKCECNGIKNIITLDSPSKGIFIDSLVWRSMMFEDENSVLMVMADSYYDESDYIRNYEEFKKIENMI